MPVHAAFNRLAMYNYTDLKRFDEALKAADVFFKECDKADYSYWIICIMDICWRV